MWFMLGAAALGGLTSFLGAEGQAGSAIRNANAASRAEGEAIQKERINKTISNSYATAFAQMGLALRKRQLQSQGAQIDAAGLATRSSVDATNAATGSVGASVQAVQSDITMRVDQALDSTNAEYEQAMQNYNNELDMMVVNTDQSAPNVRKNEVHVPSAGANLGMAFVQTAVSFATSYGLQKMQLGLGKPQVKDNSIFGMLNTSRGMGD